MPVSLAMAELVSNPAHLTTATRDVLHVEPEVVAYQRAVALGDRGQDRLGG
ncbi:hypothetical protein GV790_30140, partial [Nocardia cyriacigeorgica]|nr:hypothetical protein [Nocardia cyriacigeorgica]